MASASVNDVTSRQQSLWPQSPGTLCGWAEIFELPRAHPLKLVSLFDYLTLKPKLIIAYVVFQNQLLLFFLNHDIIKVSLNWHDIPTSELLHFIVALQFTLHAKVWATTRVCVHLCRLAGNKHLGLYVIPNDKWHPVALRWSYIKSSTLLNFTLWSVGCLHSEWI